MGLVIEWVMMSDNGVGHDVYHWGGHGVGHVVNHDVSQCHCIQILKGRKRAARAAKKI